MAHEYKKVKDLIGHQATAGITNSLSRFGGAVKMAEKKGEVVIKKSGFFGDAWTPARASYDVKTRCFVVSEGEEVLFSKVVDHGE